MKGWKKGLAYAIAGLVGLILVISTAVYGLSEARLQKTYAVAPRAVVMAADSTSTARGGHLARSIAGCVDCHGDQLQGSTVINDPVFARISGLNLTRGKGGVGGTLSDADFVRAIRHGVATDGHPLKLMPSRDYVNLSDEDLSAIIAFVRSSAPVDHEVPAQRVGPVARVLLIAGKLPILNAEVIDHAKPAPPAVPIGVTAPYGGYLASVGCMGCHGPALAGGKIAEGDPSWPWAANLTPAGATKGWSEEDFRRVLRTGKRPSGIPVNAAMPWRMYKNLSDDEIAALWLYLKSIPAAPTPGLVASSN